MTTACCLWSTLNVKELYAMASNITRPIIQPASLKSPLYFLRSVFVLLFLKLYVYVLFPSMIIRPPLSQLLVDRSCFPGAGETAASSRRFPRCISQHSAALPQVFPGTALCVSRPCPTGTFQVSEQNSPHPRAPLQSFS